MATRGQLVSLLIVLIVPVPLTAQTIEQRVQQLEKRLDDLSKQMTDVRQQLDQLKGQPPATAPEEDLTKVGTVQEAPTPAPALTDVQTVNNVQNPGASKVFNPDTSVIGNFLGKAGQPNK